MRLRFWKFLTNIVQADEARKWITHLSDFLFSDLRGTHIRGPPVVLLTVHVSTNFERSE